jgi:hypothetical protein
MAGYIVDFLSDIFCTYNISLFYLHCHLRTIYSKGPKFIFCIGIGYALKISLRCCKINETCFMDAT